MRTASRHRRNAIAAGLAVRNRRPSLAAALILLCITCLEVAVSSWAAQLCLCAVNISVACTCAKPIAQKPNARALMIARPRAIDRSRKLAALARFSVRRVRSPEPLRRVSVFVYAARRQRVIARTTTPCPRTLRSLREERSFRMRQRTRNFHELNPFEVRRRTRRIIICFTQFDRCTTAACLFRRNVIITSFQVLHAVVTG